MPLIMPHIHPNKRITISVGDIRIQELPWSEIKDYHKIKAIEAEMLCNGGYIERTTNALTIRIQFSSAYESNLLLQQGRELHDAIMGEWPSLDEQIEFMKRKRDNHLHDQRGRPAQMYRAIENNLKSIKRWAESPVYHGEVDVGKVIQDLVDLLKTDKKVYDRYEEELEVGLRNADIAIQMIQVFKEQREPSWVKDYAQVKTSNLYEQNLYEKFAQPDLLEYKHKRDQVIDQLTHSLRNPPDGIAAGIIKAIEDIMDARK